ncbi:MAG: nuclear transport factor 2 family protein [Mycobacterium sp.]
MNGAVSSPVVDRWLDVIENGQTAGLDDLLAENAIFYSPAVFTPQRGRATAAAYLRAAEHMFAGTGFHYVNTWIDTHSAVLEFAAEVDGITVEGIDMLHWNEDGRLTSVKVMIRPFKGLQVVIAKMAELLADP